MVPRSARVVLALVSGSTVLKRRCGNICEGINVLGTLMYSNLGAVHILRTQKLGSLDTPLVTVPLTQPISTNVSF